MPEKIEVERKFLVKPPNSWADLTNIFDNLVDIKRISQTYLIPEKGSPSARVRKTVEGLTGDTEKVYHFNQKEPVGFGAHREKEHEISADQYKNYLKKSHPQKEMVEKTRFVFKYCDQKFELDIFKGRLRGLAILELELKDMKQKIKLPPFLEVIKEVTGDARFNNFSLADKIIKFK